MPHIPVHTVAWTEIPVTDMDRAKSFYETVFGFEITVTDMEPNPVGMISTAQDGGISGHIYPGKPATEGQGPTIHLYVPDTVEDAMDRLVNNGGIECSPVITIPPGRFAYAQDPDGNSIGLFEPNKAS